MNSFVVSEASRGWPIYGINSLGESCSGETLWARVHPKSGRRVGGTIIQPFRERAFMMGMCSLKRGVLTAGHRRAIAMGTLGLRAWGSTSTDGTGSVAGKPTGHRADRHRMPVMVGIEMGGDPGRSFPRQGMVFLSGYAILPTPSRRSFGRLEYSQTARRRLNGVLQGSRSLHAEQWKRFYAPQQREDAPRS
jgi:hypothetical protein